MQDCLPEIMDNALVYGALILFGKFRVFQVFRHRSDANIGVTGTPAGT